ncbi:hypothetical protein HKX48_005658 [Thoreauomyces humboldtii]|nr:hypothetical protein HKX48_005658 [Thoreauomyces humboldtii]
MSFAASSAGDVPASATAPSAAMMVDVVPTIETEIPDGRDISSNHLLGALHSVPLGRVGLLPDSAALLSASTTTGEQLLYDRIAEMQLDPKERLLCLFGYKYNSPRDKAPAPLANRQPLAADENSEHYCYAPGESDAALFYQHQDWTSPPLLLCLEVKDKHGNPNGISSVAQEAVIQCVRACGEFSTRWFRHHAGKPAPLLQFAWGVVLPVSNQRELPRLQSEDTRYTLAQQLEPVEQDPADAYGLATPKALLLEPEAKHLGPRLACWEQQLESSDTLLAWIRDLATGWKNVYQHYASAGANPGDDHWMRVAMRTRALYFSGHPVYTLATASDAATFFHSLCPLTSSRLAFHLDESRQTIDRISKNVVGLGGKRLVATSEQYVVLKTKIQDLPRHVVDGFSGTGKTLCALLRAESLANNLTKGEDKVLFLCSTKPLLSFLSATWKHEAILYHNIHRFLAALLNTLGITEPLSQEEAATLLLKNYASQLPACVRKAFGCTIAHLVLDEGQDFVPQSLQLLELIMQPQADGTFWIFRDVLQAYYSGTYQNLSKCDEMPNFKDDEPSTLTYILRHSREIHDRVADSLARRLQTLDELGVRTSSIASCVLAFDQLPKGTPVATHYLNDFPDQAAFTYVRKALVKLLAACDVSSRKQRLLDRNYRTVPLAILTSYSDNTNTTRQFVSGLRKVVDEILDRHKATHITVVDAEQYYVNPPSDTVLLPSGGQPKVSIVMDTFKRFAGLEALAVIAIDPFPAPAADTLKPLYLYTGLSRAIGHLEMILHSSYEGYLKPDAKNKKQKKKSPLA